MKLAATFLLASVIAFAAPPEQSGWQLVFADEFNEAALDVNKWNYWTGPRMWSDQRPENVSVSEGMLRIALKKEKSGALD